MACASAVTCLCRNVPPLALLVESKYIFGGIATAVAFIGHCHFSAPTFGQPAVSATMPLMEFGDGQGDGVNTTCRT